MVDLKVSKKTVSLSNACDVLYKYWCIVKKREYVEKISIDKSTYAFVCRYPH